ncbi:Regulator of chromosome condensation [Entophlyctis luteolus]|nr:Regulator of chromosome condensation [Entophlyctis luteolus]
MKLKKIAYFDDKNIVDVAAGGLHNIVLSSDGKLYSWGCNDQKALEPGPVAGLEGVKVVQVKPERSSVYAWGTFRNKNGIFGFRPDIDIQPIPFQIPEISKVISISAGADHLLAMTWDRRIYTWGCGECGQLGRYIMARKEKERSLIPMPVEFKPSKKLLGDRGSGKFPKKSDHGVVYQTQFSDAWCTGNGTFLNHESGVVFSFGLNNHGQLGCGDADEHISPEPLAPFIDVGNNNLPVEHPALTTVSGSSHHTVALDRSGNVCTFGRNDDGQLGIEDSKEGSSIPQILPKPRNVVQVSANGSFSLAVTEDKSLEGNNLWLWGYGEMGQLANGGEDEPLPNCVELKGRHVYVGALLTKKPQAQELVAPLRRLNWLKSVTGLMDSPEILAVHVVSKAAAAIERFVEKQTTSDDSIGLSCQERDFLVLVAKGIDANVFEWIPNIRIRSSRCVFRGGKVDCSPYKSVPEKVVRFDNQGVSHRFSFIELFAGIGGFRLAMDSLGGRSVFASEINDAARMTYVANFGREVFQFGETTKSLLVGDITEIDASDIPDHDILTAGFPCQSFCKVGSLTALDDSRGELFFEVVLSMHCHCRAHS